MSIDPDNQKALDLVLAELARQGVMWGVERDDSTNGELMQAAMAQLEELYYRQDGDEDAFEGVPEIYPDSWSGFRDYGSDVANLVVAAAFLISEITRKVRKGESTYRKPRDPETQPYEGDMQPNDPNEPKF